jgi:hypothetical protein
MFGDAGPGERADNSASRTTHDRSADGADGSGYEPAARYHRSDTGNCQQAKTRQQTADTAYCGSDAGARPGIGGSVGRMILVISVVDVV